VSARLRIFGTMRECVRFSKRGPVPEFHYANFGSFCLKRPILAQGSLRRRPSRTGRLSTVYWLAPLSAPSSDHSIGVETGAPGRARVGEGATAVASRLLRK